MLLAWTKIVLAEELLDSDLPDDPYLDLDLRAYFPTQVREGFGQQVEQHPLRREIIVTQVVNDLVNGAGMTFWPRLAGETGATAAELTRANFVAREIFGSLDLRRELTTYDNQLDAAVQTRMRLEMRTLVERASRWLVNNRRPPLDSAGDRRAVRGAGAAHDGRAARPDERPRADGVRRAQGVARVRGRARGPGAPDRGAAAGVHAAGRHRDRRTARASTRATSPGCTSRSASGSGCRRLVQRILALPRDDRWQTMARAALRDDLHAVHAQLTGQVLAHDVADDSAAARIAAWEDAEAVVVPRAAATLEEICADDQADLARLSVGLRVVRGLLAVGLVSRMTDLRAAGVAETARLVAAGRSPRVPSSSRRWRASPSATRSSTPSRGCWPRRRSPRPMPGTRRARRSARCTAYRSPSRRRSTSPARSRPSAATPTRRRRPRTPRSSPGSAPRARS